MESEKDRPGAGSFPRAAVENQHKLNRKQHKCIILQFWRLEAGSDIKVRAGLVLPGRSAESSISQLFQLPAMLAVPSAIFKARCLLFSASQPSSPKTLVITLGPPGSSELLSPSPDINYTCKVPLAT